MAKSEWSLSKGREKVFNLYKKRAAKYKPARTAGPDYLDKIVKLAAVSQFTQLLGTIPYAIVGGFAVALHGNPRLTQDIDLLVSPNDLPAAQQAMERAGGRASNSLSIGGVAMSVNGTEVDLIALDAPWANEAIGSATSSSQGRVVTKPYLVLMKLWASRGEQEDLDMITLLRGMGQPEWNQTLGLVKKYLPNDVDDIKNLREYSTLDSGAKNAADQAAH